jgi:hypothetical protein
MPKPTTRERLATVLCRETGALFEAHMIYQNSNLEVAYRDVCRWDAWGTLPAEGTLGARKLHVYSWDTMGDCVKKGIALIKSDYLDWEVSTK